MKRVPKLQEQRLLPDEQDQAQHQRAMPQDAVHAPPMQQVETMTSMPYCA